LKKNFFNIPTINGAIVSLDNNGAIKALVGSTSYSQSTYNRAIQTKRPIGSTMKSLIYAQAFDQKFNLITEIQDSPHNLIDYQGFSWRPNNSNNNYLGTISLETAFTKSVNLATISLAQSLDLNHLWKCLESVSKKTLKKNPSLILGSYEMSPLELATIYTSFCNKGIFNTNPYITEKQNQSHMLSLCSEQSAYLMRYLQKEILKKGNPKLAHYAGGKTGTTNDHADLWFAGFHHNITTVVWIGYDKPQSTKCYASQLALPIWSLIAQNDGVAESAEYIPDSVILKKIGKDFKPFWIQKVD
jgi:penicillin-binding protein 1A